MTTTPNPTAEQIIEEVLHPFPERVWLSHRIVARLRAAGLLGGDPTEERIERAAQAMHAASSGFFSEASWRALAREGLAAADAATQSTPTEVPQRDARCPECFELGGAHGSVHVRHPQGGGGWNRPCSRAAGVAPQEPSAKVVIRGFDTDCAAGICPGACSHLMWYCDRCTSEGGWGAPRDLLEQWAADHVCPVPDTGDEKQRIEVDLAHLSGRLVIDETALAEVIETARRRWDGSGRHEPISTAITRAVMEHLGGGR
ncbi:MULTISPECIES: hypothetical protein [unclassified Leucobacter]|uniref:hypothetical protein n=1 Tax=unclassified Leucobacter TaxID=2621730 RepID=UPI0030170F01